MFRRTFTVVHKPAKSNYVILSDAYFKLVNTYERGCLNLSFQNQCQFVNHYISWASYSASNLQEYEIGINPLVAQNLGLKEGSLVKCSLVSEVLNLESVTASATCQKDWELLQMGSNRIQTTLLDQTRIVNDKQCLVIWINMSIFITLKIEKLAPDISFGRLENNTEIIIAPFKSPAAEKASRPLSYIDSTQTNGNYKLSHCQSEMMPFRQSIKVDQKLASRARQLDEMTKLLEKEAPRSYEFRVVPGNWDEDTQMSEIFVDQTKELDINLNFNQIFTVKTNSDKEYYVNVKTLCSKKMFPKSVNPSVEINGILMKLLNLEPFEKITLKPKNSVLNFIDKIELVPNKEVQYRQLREIEESFKKFIIDNSRASPILINQSQIFKIDPDLYVTVNLLPETFKFCVIDAGVLRETRIQCVEKVKPIDDLLKLRDAPVVEDVIFDEKKFVKIRKFDCIAEEMMERLKINLCLDERNKYRKMENLIIAGSYNSGKSVICSKILHELSQSPFNSYFDIFFCSRNKGRKPESIQKDLRQIFTSCMNFCPSVLLLDNLDMLTHSVSENSQDTEYCNRISDIIHSLIVEFTPRNSISVIATVSSISNLNKRIYTSRGRHIFHNITTIPELETEDRETIIKELCSKCKLAKHLNWKRFAGLTEGYRIGDLVQFVERAMFYAYRNDAKSPILDDNMLIQSLKTTNSYCLQGIENHQSLDKENEDEVIRPEEIAGMEKVVEVLQEVLIWPTKFPKLFDNSPLRNQAGVLLFGYSGTGKTYLVSQIAKSWNLRMISVKGPELLAKYIGQSEENVRNLFNKARSAKPCVLFFDEFDSLAPRRGHDSTGVTDRVVNQLLTELDGVQGLNGVTVIAATSRPELLDPALLRSGRIDRLVECTLPNREAREEIFENLSITLNLEENVDFEPFLDLTDNFTGADIQSMLTTANMIAVKECLAKDPVNVPDEIFIFQRHMEEAFKDTRPSLSAADIKRYRVIYDRFTHKDKNPPDFNFVAKRATLA